MTADTRNIYTAEPLATGVCFVSPLGTTGPTDAVTPIATISPDWVDLGYTGADGFNEKNDRKIDLKRAFGGGIVKVIQTEYSASLEFTFMESLNANVLKAVFGASNVQVVAANTHHGNQVTVNKNAIRLPYQSWIIDTYDDELGAKYRNYAPNATLTTIADIKVVHTDVIEYKVTLECLPTVANGNDNIVTFTDDGQILGS